MTGWVGPWNAEEVEDQARTVREFSAPYLVCRGRRLRKGRGKGGGGGGGVEEEEARPAKCLLS